MLEFDITSSTYDLISKKLATLQQDKSNVKDIRDDIIGNNAIRNTYIELGILQNIEGETGRDIECLKSLFMFPASSKADLSQQQTIESHDFIQWLNHVTDGICDFSLCIDNLMILCSDHPSNIDILLNSPFLLLCGNFLRTSQSSKTNSKLLTFLSFLSFERDTVRKKIVELGILKLAIRSLHHKDNELVLSSCLLLRSISRSVKLIRTAFDTYCFESLMMVFTDSIKTSSDQSVDIKRAISAVFCNFAMEHSPFRNVNLLSYLGYKTTVSFQVAVNPIKGA